MAALVHRAGPATFFVLSTATLSATLAWALSQQAFWNLGHPGSATPPSAEASLSGLPGRSRS